MEKVTYPANGETICKSIEWQETKERAEIGVRGEQKKMILNFGKRV
jgi:hypothetical protein